MDKFKLKKKLVFIVGGAGLIGKEISKLAIKAESEVIILDVNKMESKEIIKKINNKKIKYEFFDCTDTSNLSKNFKKIIKKYGCPNIFINCSYPVSRDWKNSSFEKVSKETLDENIIIHLCSYSWLAKIVSEEMVNNQIKGSIINFGSIYGVVGQDLSIYKNTKMKENMPYSIIKGGIANLTRQMASYYGKYGIRINTISPGGLIGHVKGKSKKQDTNFIKNYSNKVPLGRLGNATEVAYSALFLASDASSYITGFNLMVDGGWTAI